jgi:hypothetical protein
MPRLTLLCGFLLALWSTSALAQQSERYGPYELHYSVVNTTFLDPQVARAYGITRGKQRAILNLALREHLEGGGAVPRAMTLQGRSRDLIQQQVKLDFNDIREGEAIYYIAEFSFINEEWRHFDIEFQPEGLNATYTFKFKYQMYTD